jgi:LPXTG-motif cell wall-anchored protein
VREVEELGNRRSSTFVFATAYVAVVAVLFLVLGGAAYAQTPATDQYAPTGTLLPPVAEQPTVVAGEEIAQTESTATASEALPNTGLSLIGVAVIGGGLVAAGLALRRREQRKH